MKRWKPVLIAVLAAVLVCALALTAIHGIFAGHAGTITLWYIRGDCSDTQLEALAKKYNRSAGRAHRALELSGFDSEQALADAFQDRRPDLLLCSYIKAGDLYDRGLLARAAVSAAEYPPAVLEAAPSAGTCFFPLGSEVQLLVENSRLCSESFDSLEALLEWCGDYAGSSGEAAFSAGSYADMINAAMCSLDAPFNAQLKTDAKDPDFRRVYNLLADCGYAKALLDLGAGSAEAVAQGQLPCACVSSRQLAGLDSDGLRVSVLPLPEGGEAVCPAELMGLAVTSEDAEAIVYVAQLLDWLERDGRGAGLAMASALVPLSLPEKSGGYAWEAAIRELCGYELSFSAEGGAFAANREEFAGSFGAALDLLR